MTDLDDTIALYTPKLRRAARLYRNRVHNMESDDVFQEMCVVLVRSWRWCQTQDEPADLAAVFWTAWSRKLINLLRDAKRRVYESLDDGKFLDAHDALAERFARTEPLYDVAEILADLDPEAATVARMRADGWQANEIQHLLGISRRNYYERWRRVSAAAA